MGLRIQVFTMSAMVSVAVEKARGLFFQRIGRTRRIATIGLAPG